MLTAPRSIIHHPFHPPSVFPSADCPPYISLIQKPAYGAPTLHLFFQAPCTIIRPSHLTLGHPFLYLHSCPNLFFILLIIVQTLFPHFHSFLLSPLATFLFRQRNPCHPWLGNFSLPNINDTIHKTPSILQPIHLFDLCVCPLCHTSGTTHPRLVIPLALDSVLRLLPLCISPQPREVLSLTAS
jgi:hypothetical protein